MTNWLAFRPQTGGSHRPDGLYPRRRRRPAAGFGLNAVWGALVTLLLLAGVTGSAGPLLDPGATNAPAPTHPSDFLSDWFARVSRTQAEQPHWITPLATVTPRLEEEIRYDQVWQVNPGRRSLTSFGGAKGLELIPAERIETILGIPAWQSWNRPPGTDGWSDENFLVKYRLVAANETRGNYIVSLFLGLTLPTGSAHNTAKHVLVTPTIAFGKGWGDFDIQGTLAVSMPDNGAAPAGLGTPLLSNTTFQYRLLHGLWPEFEVNYTGWPNGVHRGKNQVFLTPGLVLGRLPVWRRVGFTFGVGYQIAVTARPLYNHSIIVSARLPF